MTDCQMPFTIFDLFIPVAPASVNKKIVNETVILLLVEHQQCLFFEINEKGKSSKSVSFLTIIIGSLKKLGKYE